MRLCLMFLSEGISADRLTSNGRYSSAPSTTAPMTSAWALLLVLCLSSSFSVVVEGASSNGWATLDNANAMAGSPSSCVNSTAPFFCYGTFLSPQDCFDACKSDPLCSVMTWSGHSHLCWSRRDRKWTTSFQKDLVSACNTASVKDCSKPNPPYVGPISVTIDVTKPLGATHPLSPAICLDFWRADDPSYGPRWGNSSVLYLNLSDPKLRALASSLSPALFRLGGSPEDNILFDADGTCKPLGGGRGPSKNYYCSQVQPYIYDCLTPSRWNELLQFASETGLRIAFGLNGCYGRTSSTSSMDFSNIAALFKATTSSPFASALWGFEFTNEIVLGTIGATAWAKDIATIYSLAVQIFGEANIPIPNFVGPDQTSCDAISAVAPLVPPNTVSAYTYHQYADCVAPLEPDGYLLHPACLEIIDQMGTHCAQAGLKSKSRVGIWAGESAEHSTGGIPNLTDSFRSSLYYAWQLSALPGVGVELAARQTLSGGDYELLQRGSLDSNPDFFLLWIFHSLIEGGSTSVEVTQSVQVSDSGIRVFAFSSASLNATVVVAIDLRDDSSRPTSIILNGTLGTLNRIEYHLKGDPNVSHGTVTCNGAPLKLDPTTHLPPPLKSLRVNRKGALVSEPGSIAFALILPA